MAVDALCGETVLKRAKAIEVEEPAAAVAALVSQHASMVFRIAYSILRNHHDAEDAAQECFLRVLKVQKRLAEVRNPKTWLARIAWTAALDRRRRRPALPGREQAEDHEILSDLPDGAARIDDLLASRQIEQLLERLVAGLGEELRHPLQLSTVHELSSTEIAAIMKIPESSVRTRLLRGRRILKEKLTVLLEGRKHG